MRRKNKGITVVEEMTLMGQADEVVGNTLEPSPTEYSWSCPVTGDKGRGYGFKGVEFEVGYSVIEEGIRHMFYYYEQYGVAPPTMTDLPQLFIEVVGEFFMELRLHSLQNVLLNSLDHLLYFSQLHECVVRAMSKEQKERFSVLIP